MGSRVVQKREGVGGERELAVVRRELEVARGGLQSEQAMGGEQRRSARSITSERDPSHPSVTVIADLVSCFDGRSDSFENWEKQIRQVQVAYRLEDNIARILVGMRLKGKAQEWLHSRPEYTTMTLEQLLGECRTIFHRKENRIEARRRFEERMWKRDEAFRDYFHQKITLGNQVPVKDDEVLHYVIEGIPDETLRNQARIQRFETIDKLLEACERVTLHERSASSMPRAIKFSRTNGRGDDQVRRNNMRKSSASGNDTNRFINRSVCCYNCGERDHVSAKCPTKDKGTKCFRYGERGHIASRCETGSRADRESGRSCNVLGVSPNKCLKTVRLNGCKFEALVDSGSDLSLVRADEYIRLGAPRATE